MAKIINLGWSKQPINLEIILEVEEKAKLVLLSKILSAKNFSRLVVKEIVAKAWNIVNVVEVAALDNNIFSFTFAHEVDVIRVWDR